MTKTQKNLIQLGVAGCIFGLIMMIFPASVLLWILIIPGAVALWLGCLGISTWIVSWLEDWLEDRND